MLKRLLINIFTLHFIFFSACSGSGGSSGTAATGGLDEDFEMINQIDPNAVDADSNKTNSTGLTGPTESSPVQDESEETALVASTDNDQDGFSTPLDCDDENPDVNTSIKEGYLYNNGGLKTTHANNIDDNCNGIIDEMGDVGACGCGDFFGYKYADGVLQQTPEEEKATSLILDGTNTVPGNDWSLKNATTQTALIQKYGTNPDSPYVQSCTDHIAEKQALPGFDCVPIEPGDVPYTPSTTGPNYITAYDFAFKLLDKVNSDEDNLKKWNDIRFTINFSDRMSQKDRYLSCTIGEMSVYGAPNNTTCSEIVGKNGEACDQKRKDAGTYETSKNAADAGTEDQDTLDYLGTYSSYTNDLDKDGLLDAMDDDMDGDGLPNVEDTDKDADGLPDPVDTSVSAKPNPLVIMSMALTSLLVGSQPAASTPGATQPTTATTGMPTDQAQLAMINSIMAMYATTAAPAGTQATPVAFDPFAQPTAPTGDPLMMALIGLLSSAATQPSEAPTDGTDPAVSTSKNTAFLNGIIAALSQVSASTDPSTGQPANTNITSLLLGALMPAVTSGDPSASADGFSALAGSVGENPNFIAQFGALAMPKLTGFITKALSGAGSKIFGSGAGALAKLGALLVNPIALTIIGVVGVAVAIYVVTGYETEGARFNIVFNPSDPDVFSHCRGTFENFEEYIEMSQGTSKIRSITIDLNGHESTSLGIDAVKFHAMYSKDPSRGVPFYINPFVKTYLNGGPTQNKDNQKVTEYPNAQTEKSGTKACMGNNTHDGFGYDMETQIGNINNLAGSGRAPKQGTLYYPVAPKLVFSPSDVAVVVQAEASAKAGDGFETDLSFAFEEKKDGCAENAGVEVFEKLYPGTKKTAYFYTSAVSSEEIADGGRFFMAPKMAKGKLKEVRVRAIKAWSNNGEFAHYTLASKGEFALHYNPPADQGDTFADDGFWDTIDPFNDSKNGAHPDNKRGEDLPLVYAAFYDAINTDVNSVSGGRVNEVTLGLPDPQSADGSTGRTLHPVGDDSVSDSNEGTNDRSAPKTLKPVDEKNKKDKKKK